MATASGSYTYDGVTYTATATYTDNKNGTVTITSVKGTKSKGSNTLSGTGTPKKLYIGSKTTNISTCGYYTSGYVWRAGTSTKDEDYDSIYPTTVNAGTYTCKVTGDNLTIAAIKGKTWTWTFKSVVKPTVAAPAISSITNNSVYAKASVSNNGGGTITANSIVVSKTNFGTAVKTLSSLSGTISGLEAGQLYYARAQATNSTGTGYSAVKSFATKPNITITPEAVSETEINLHRAWSKSASKCYYYIYDKDGNAIAENIYDGNTSNGITFYRDSITGLKPGTTYKVKIRMTYETGNYYDTTGTTTALATVTTKSRVNVAINGEDYINVPVSVSVNGGAFTKLDGGVNVL